MVVVIAGTCLAVRRIAQNTAARVLAPKEEVVDITALVTRVRELSRLETASMRVIHVSTITQSYQLVPDAVAGDELTLLATGDVIAGIDLSQIGADDVWREADGTVVMRLPPAQILVSRIDNRETRVIHRRTGMLRKGDPHLESRARQNAEAGIRQEALRRGIVQLARESAEKKLADFVKTFGVTRIRFVTPEARPE